MGILEMHFERILGAFFHSCSHSTLEYGINVGVRLFSYSFLKNLEEEEEKKNDRNTLIDVKMN